MTGAKSQQEKSPAVSTTYRAFSMVTGMVPIEGYIDL
jgi:hypothetical protein